MRKYIFLYIIVSLLAVLGCDTKRESKTKTVKHVPEIVKVSYEKNTGDCDNLNSDNCAKIVINAFEIKDPWDSQIQTVINNKMKNVLLKPIEEGKSYKNIEDMMNDFLESYKIFKTKFPDVQQKWEIERTARVKYINQDFISAEYSENSYLGGAHPNSDMKYENVNLHTAKKIGLRNILTEGFENELNRVAEEIFRHNNEMTKDDDLKRAGFWFKDNKFALNNNFGIDNKGLSFHFSSYEIAPYATGPTELFIPYIKIKNLILDEGILKPFLKNYN